MKELTGIPINYMITVNFRAFRNIVDRLDGVYMDVDRRYFNDNSGATVGTYATIDLKPGYQNLNGRDALDFVRFRHTDSDLYRVVRQQEFVKAVKQRVSSTWDIFQLPGIVKAITENIEVAKGGGKSISSGEVLGYANALYGLPAGNFQQVPLDGITGYNELALDPTSLGSAVRHFLNPDVKAGDKAVAVATGTKPQGRERAAAVAGQRRGHERERRRRSRRRGRSPSRPGGLQRPRTAATPRTSTTSARPSSTSPRSTRRRRPRRRWPTSSARPR